MTFWMLYSFVGLLIYIIVAKILVKTELINGLWLFLFGLLCGPITQLFVCTALMVGIIKAIREKEDNFEA